MVSNQIPCVKTYPSFKKEKGIKISRKHYTMLFSLYCIFIRKKILQGYLVSLPAGLGNLQIIGKKIKFENFTKRKQVKSINWKATNKLRASGREGFIYFLNEHTENITYKLCWKNTKHQIINKTFYKFTPCRGIKKSMGEKINTGQEYLIN
jgi:hypothetical protein